MPLAISVPPLIDPSVCLLLAMSLLRSLMRNDIQPFSESREQVNRPCTCGHVLSDNAHDPLCLYIACRHFA